MWVILYHLYVDIWSLVTIDISCRHMIEMCWEEFHFVDISPLTSQILISSDGHLDGRDAQWTGDKDLSPLDVGSLDARSFVIYKFGSYIAGAVAARCNHAPVTVLLADRIPANPHLTRNLYRNSFHFDANNRILYMRAARLDTVGEFVLVLVHCLAHIKAGEWGMKWCMEEIALSVFVFCCCFFLLLVQPNFIP